MAGKVTPPSGGADRPMDRVQYTPANPKKLIDAVRKTYKQDMKWIREEYRKLMTEFAGDHYGKDKIDHKVLVNKINHLVVVYMHLLASNNPRVLVTAQYDNLKSFGLLLEIALNRLFQEIDLQEPLNRCVMDALVLFGVAKTGIAEGNTYYEIDGSLYDPGQPFTESINPNNFVIDLQAECIEQIDYIGDRYTRPREWVDKVRNEQGETRNDLKPEDRVSGIQDDPEKSITKKVWLWDIYLPKHQRILTFVEDEDDPIMEKEWKGPERGPYEVLQFHPIPGEVLGVSPCMTLYNSHQTQNNLLRKVVNQAERQKSLSVVEKGDEGDLLRISKANDGDCLALNKPDAAKEVNWGGPNLANHNLAMWFEQVFDTHAGNLSLLAGLSPQSETYRQDQLLSNAANIRVDSMKRSVLRFARNIIKRHAWYLFFAQFEDQTLRVPVTDEIEVYETLSPEEREGDFIEYNFDIDPYSLREESPNEKAQKLMGIVNQFVLPMAEPMQQQGWMPNLEAIGRELARLSNIDFEDLFIPADPNMQQQMAQQEKPGQVPMPPRFKQSHTVNERVSRAGTTERGNTNALAQSNAAMMSKAQAS